MKLTFDPSNEDELFCAYDIVSALRNAHCSPDVPDWASKPTLVETTPLPDPLASAGKVPPPPPPGAPDIAPDNTEQSAAEQEAVAETVQASQDSSVPLVGATLDAAGIPWDARIHSSGKTLKKDNSWVRRRGVDDATYQKVVAEITAAPQVTAAPADAPATAGAAVPPPPSTTGGSTVPPPPGSTGPAHAEPDDEAPAPAFGAETAGKWQDIVQKVMLAKVSEQITMEDLDGEAARLGVSGGFLNLISRPDLFGDIEMWLMSKGVM